MKTLAIVLVILVCGVAVEAAPITDSALKSLGFKVVMSCGVSSRLLEVQEGKHSIQIYSDMGGVSLIVKRVEVPLLHIRTKEQLSLLIQLLLGEWAPQE